MEANIAFFGLSFVLFGIFNLVFFRIYYKDVNKVGKAFLISSIVVFLYIMVVESCTHILFFAKNYLDTKRYVLFEGEADCLGCWYVDL